MVTLQFVTSPRSDFPALELPQSKTLSETVSLDVDVGVVSGSSQRAGSDLRYFMSGGNIDDTFQVLQNGRITLKRAPDFERAQNFELWIEVRDVAHAPPLSTFARIDVRVLDANDNAPRFDQLFYDAHVSEGHVGVVTQVSASDADSDLNAEVTYTIVSGNDNDVFEIDDVGRVATASGQVLDREAVEVYRLIVQATDRGSPAMSASATVVVTVDDVNDEQPFFTDLYSSEIAEDTPVGTEVIKITISDRDVGVNALQTFSFVSTSGPFSINATTGIITLTSALDRETQGSYSLRVSATDGVFTSTTNWIVQVLDVNDNPPRFADDVSYAFEAAVGQEVGTVIGDVTASDADGSGANSDIVYFLKNPDSNFRVDSTSGAVSIWRELTADEVVTAQHSRVLTVLASDRGLPSLEAYQTVHVTLRRRNSAAPTFHMTDDVIFAAENSEVGQIVTRLEIS